MNGSTVVIIPPKGSMKDYLESLVKLQHYTINVMAPGHGELIENPQEVVQWTITHRLQREDKVRQALSIQQPQSVEQLVPVVYADTDPGLHSIAALSLHAHLIKLDLDGEANCDNERWTLAS